MILPRNLLKSLGPPFSSNNLVRHRACRSANLIVIG
jgi:hypothetical protein